MKRVTTLSGEGRVGKFAVTIVTNKGVRWTSAEQITRHKNLVEAIHRAISDTSAYAQDILVK